MVDAVRCVLEMQTEMTARGTAFAEDRRIAFRVGVNVGDIIADGDDIFGDGVNVAARLLDLTLALGRGAIAGLACSVPFPGARCDLRAQEMKTT